MESTAEPSTQPSELAKACELTTAALTSLVSSAAENKVIETKFQELKHYTSIKGSETARNRAGEIAKDLLTHDVLPPEVMMNALVAIGFAPDLPVTDRITALRSALQGVKDDREAGLVDRQGATAMVEVIEMTLPHLVFTQSVQSLGRRGELEE